LVLELVEGPTLADRVASGPLPVAEALIIGRQIADALGAVHEKGIVHRDLKPANVVLQTTTGAAVRAVRVRVLDFGLGKLTAIGPVVEGEEGPSTPARLPRRIIQGVDCATVRVH
jgi:serine/threonine protein kinase